VAESFGQLRPEQLSTSYFGYLYKDHKYQLNHCNYVKKENAVVIDQICWDEFIDSYLPIPNHIDKNAGFDGHGFETYGPELTYVQAQCPQNIWTILDCDGEIIVSSGYHHVNRLGYIISRIPVPFDTQIEVYDGY